MGRADDWLVYFNALGVFNLCLAVDWLFRHKLNSLMAVLGNKAVAVLAGGCVNGGRKWQKG